MFQLLFCTLPFQKWEGGGKGRGGGGASCVVLACCVGMCYVVVGVGPAIAKSQVVAIATCYSVHPHNSQHPPSGMMSLSGHRPHPLCHIAMVMSSTATLTTRHTQEASQLALDLASGCHG